MLPMMTVAHTAALNEVRDSDVRPPGPIWVDERDAIYRRGLVACLEDEGYSIAGQSARLRPRPNPAPISLLIFDVDAAGFDRAAAFARRRDMLSVGVVRTTPAGRIRDLLASGLSALLRPTTLTPAGLLSCIRALSDEGASAPGERLGTTIPVEWGPACRAQERHLNCREFDVLCLLAEGESTGEIAQRLSYSERTIKNIVHDLLAKLDGRTRAHAVRVAAQRGII